MKIFGKRFYGLFAICWRKSSKKISFTLQKLAKKLLPLQLVIKNVPYETRF